MSSRLGSGEGEIGAKGTTGTHGEFSTSNLRFLVLVTFSDDFYFGES